MPMRRRVREIGFEYIVNVAIMAANRRKMRRILTAAKIEEINLNMRYPLSARHRHITLYVAEAKYRITRADMLVLTTFKNAIAAAFCAQQDGGKVVSGF